MGGKRAGQGKQIHFFIAILIILNPLACTLSKMVDTKIVATKVMGTREEDARAHVAHGRKYIAKGDYGSALRENEKAVSLAGSGSPADEALFSMGLIYAHPANQAKDYGKALVFFRRLIKEHPRSPFVEQAQAVMGILQENDKLSRMIERLNTIIDELKKVDIGVDQKKRENAK